ncbi:MAG: hypothetical protein DRJ03_21745 [Chloroflexi bacterium]|nr:MAG: hypothetical protein DRJ03_21745 [Chloroflexota bacterium]
MVKCLKRKNIPVSKQTHERIVNQGRYGQTLEDIILEKWEEREFKERAKPILEKAKRIEEKHQKVGSNWAEIEESWHELITLVDEFLKELETR